MSDGIRVNGNAYSWGSIRLKLDSERYFQLNEITYADKRERALFWGMGTHHAPTARSRGKYTPENPKFKCLLETGDLIRQHLSSMNAVGGASYGETEFDILVQYAETDPTGATKIIDVVLLDCVYIGTNNPATEGPDPLTEEIEVQCMRILRNGLPLYDDSGDGQQ